MKNKKSIVICALLVAIVAMAIGYATLSQDLIITGTANIDADWNVKITGIEAGTLDRATSGEIDYTDTTATFDVTLTEPGASATYNISIANAGKIDAVLTSIEGIEEANADAPTDLIFSISGVEVGDELPANTGTDTAVVTVTWDSDSEEIPETKSKTATITLIYEQAVETATPSN